MPILVPKGPDKAEMQQWLKGRNKYMTGFCNDINKKGCHEGTKPKSYTGKPMKTCPFWLECPCECHWNVDQLFKMTGQERREVPNPEYKPERSHFVMPEYASPLGLTPASSPDGAMDTPDDERPVATPYVPAPAPLAERRTDTGRAARGGLEAQVWEACSTLTLDPLTPKIIGEWIANKYKIPTPSSGAINAVWDRWEKMEFCTQAKKPNRFTGFVGEGTWDELQRKKVSGKVQKKINATKERLAIRQPEKRRR